MGRGVWQATVHGVARVEKDLVTKPPPPKTFTSYSSETVIMLPSVQFSSVQSLSRVQLFEAP